MDEDMNQTDADDYSMTQLAVRNYVENKHSKGDNPTVKLVRSLQMVRDIGWDTSKVADVLDQMGFVVGEGLEDQTALTDQVIYPNDLF